MRCLNSNAGFSIVEAMVAVMILTIGLTAVAGMQVKALQGNSFAWSFSTGSNAALSWLEWYAGFMSQQDQPSITYNGKLCRQNFARLSLLDTDITDTDFTEVEVPGTTAGLLSAFEDTYNYTQPDGTNFTAEQVPQPTPPGGRIVWRIAANVPVPDLTTLEVSCIYRTAFVRDAGPTLRMVFSSNM